jgi:two-component system sensor histidine kinase NreB
MRVTDDGVGFLPGIADTGPSQLGLVSMPEQAAIAGGTCQVVSAPGVGTTVELRLPISTIG